MAPASVLRAFSSSLNASFSNAIRSPGSDRETPEFMRDFTRAISFYRNDLVPLAERLLKIYERALAELPQKQRR